MACWARCLGDCSEKMSQEHTVSACLYPEQEVMVQGLPWCKDKPKKVGINALTQPILCKKHNGELGTNVDWASRHTRDTLGEAFDLYTSRKKVITRSWSVKYFETDMFLLERWCLKTLINMNNQSGWKYEDGSDPDSPPVEFVEVAFGKRRFNDHKGLYLVARTGVQREMNDGWVGVTTKTKDDKVMGATFDLWGIEFYLNLQPEQLWFRDATLMRHNFKFWFHTVDDKSRQVKSHRVSFNYPIVKRLG